MNPALFIDRLAFVESFWERLHRRSRCLYKANAPTAPRIYERDLARTKRTKNPAVWPASCDGLA